MRELTHEDVEERIIQRVRSKAQHYDKHSGITLLTLLGRGVSNGYTGYGDVAATLYRDWIIPLTKEVEVETLLLRFQDTQHFQTSR